MDRDIGDGIGLLIADYRLRDAVAGVAVDVGEFGPSGGGSREDEDVAVAHAQVLGAGGGGAGDLADGGVSARAGDGIAEGGANGGVGAPDETEATCWFEGGSEIGAGIFVHTLFPIVG